jgi:hypothetical protein
MTISTIYDDIKPEPQFTPEELQFIYKSVLKRKGNLKTQLSINKSLDCVNMNNVCENILQKVAPFVGENI